MTRSARPTAAAGCTLGDLIAEWFVFAVPVTLFGEKIFGSWAVDFVVGLVLRRRLSVLHDRADAGTVVRRRRSRRRLKADSLSLTAWQVGMYGWMAIATFVIFGHELAKTDPVFWFMMQIAMLAGFLTAYPVNWWLLRDGMKEKM